MIRLLLVLLVAVSASAANRAVLVRDIATRALESSSDPRLVAAGETLLYFTADTPAYGRELWVTDGTQAGTRIVLDIVPGAGSAHGIHGRTLGDRLIFAAGVAAGDDRLWVTDGTREGTRRLFADEPIDPTQFVAHNGKMFFIARKAATGTLLWVTDGTVAGTRHLATGHVGWTGKLQVVDGQLYFLAGFTPVDGTNLYRTDGTTVEQIGPANAAHDYTILNGRFVGANNLRLFRRESNTEPLTILHNSFSYRFFRIGSTVYFSGLHATLGMELWKTDGTPAGTTLVADVVPGSASSDPSPIGELHGRLLFVTRAGELWTSDGTAEGTFLLRDVDGSYANGWNAAVAKLGDRMYIPVVDNDGDGVLWRTDGTASGTEIIGTVADRVAMAFRGSVYFPAETYGLGVELSRMNNTSGPQLVVNLGGSTTSSTPRSLVPAHGVLYFIANDGSGPALWRSDGTDRGTSVVWRSPLTPTPIAACGDYLYFGSQTLSSLDATGQVRPLSHAALSNRPACAGGTFFFVGAGSRLHATEGRDVRQLTETSAGELVSIGNRVIFVRAPEGSIHVTDGTTAGTRELARVDGFKSGSLTAAESQAFFVAANQLWVTDGTPEGTRAIRAGLEIPPFTYATLGRQLFYLHLRTLWRSDGTPEGTFQVPGAPTLLEFNLTATTGAVYFATELPNARRAVWRTDGTTAGTYPTGAAFSHFDGAMFGLGDVLFIRERNVLTMSGARTGTIVLPEDSHLPTFVRAGDYLFFPADNGLYGEELWMADLTPRRRAARH